MTEPDRDLIQNLLHLSDKDFYSIVDREIRGSLGPEEALALRSDPALLERWYQALVRMKKSVEGTLGAKKEDMRCLRLDAKTKPAALEAAALEFAKWRGGAIRFKVGVEERLTAVRVMRFTATPGLISSAAILERDLANTRVRALEAAIRAHQEKLASEGRLPDTVLWSYLPENTHSDFATVSVDGTG